MIYYNLCKNVKTKVPLTYTIIIKKHDIIYYIFNILNIF
jgi:hypothetical protein